jgi:hypothetical protein
MKTHKKMLYRKVNTCARNIHHGFGGDYKHERNPKHKQEEDSYVKHASMHGTKHRGLDYTPLFKFLLTKIGSDWDDVYSEAVSRLDRDDPIFWMVAIYEHNKEDCVRIGESSYYSGLYVDEEKRLRVVNPEFGVENVKLSCSCCTHSFNGIPINRRK